MVDVVSTHRRSQWLLRITNPSLERSVPPEAVGVPMSKINLCPRIRSIRFGDSVSIFELTALPSPPDLRASPLHGKIYGIRSAQTCVDFTAIIFFYACVWDAWCQGRPCTRPRQRSPDSEAFAGDFISGPRLISASSILSRENTGILTAK